MAFRLEKELVQQRIPEKKPPETCHEVGKLTFTVVRFVIQGIQRMEGEIIKIMHREPITLFLTQAVSTSTLESLTGLSLHHELSPSFSQNLSFLSFFLFQVHLMKREKPKTFESSVDVT